MAESSTSPSPSPSQLPKSPYTIKSSSITLTRNEDFTTQNHPHLSLGLLNPPPPPPPSPNTTPKKPPYVRSSDSVPLKELILLSPSPKRKSSKTRISGKTEIVEEELSPHRRSSKTRVSERNDTVEENIDAVGTKKRCKNNRASPMGLQSCASPRNVRRSRRRLEQENREEKEMGQIGVDDQIAKPKKRRTSNRPRKERSVPSSSLSPKAESDDQMGLDHIKQLIADLVMWRDVAKSSLWFGFGSLCFLSSCSSRGIRFSIFSGVSHLGLLFLALSFFSNSFSQRNTHNENKLDFKLNEDDIVRVARRILPVANFVIGKTRELFSGDPSTTLKVAPILLFGAEYGHLITLWRLCATGFFMSFTVPILYSCYSMRINRKVELLGGWLCEAWRACTHKRTFAVSAALAFWNLSSIKTRIFSVFVSMVLFRYYRQNAEAEVVEVEQVMERMEVDEEEQRLDEQLQQALVVLEDGGSQK